MNHWLISQSILYLWKLKIGINEWESHGFIEESKDKLGISWFEILKMNELGSYWNLKVHSSITYKTRHLLRNLRKDLLLNESSKFSTRKETFV